MIYFSFRLSNPFSNRKFTSVYKTSGKTWMPHKFWDLTICKNNSIIGFTLDFTMRQDHAGFGLDFDFLGWDVDFRVYDHRHWNNKNNCWENYE